MRWLADPEDSTLLTTVPPAAALVLALLCLLLVPVDIYIGRVASLQGASLHTPLTHARQCHRG